MVINGGSGGPSLDKYSSAMEQKKQLKDEQHSLKASLVVLQQLLTQTLTTSGVVSGGVTVASITSPRLLEIKTRERLNRIVRNLVMVIIIMNTPKCSQQKLPVSTGRRGLLPRD